MKRLALGNGPFADQTEVLVVNVDHVHVHGIVYCLGPLDVHDAEGEMLCW